MRDQRLPELVCKRPVAGMLYLLVCLGLLVSSRASAQVKPYFLVIVDTSGSMAWCSGGSGSFLGRNDCSCHAGDNCDNAFLTNRCGFPSNKLGDAKCALQRIVDGVGSDAVFALMQFEHPCSSTCQDSGDRTDLPACDPQSTGADDAFDDGELLASFDLATPGNANIRQWVDGACTGSCTNDYTRELTAGWWTPIGQSLVRANDFLHGLSSPGFLYPTQGNVQPPSPLAGDSALACRKVSVILLTDGTENCQGDPVAAATALNTGDPKSGSVANKAIATYVIGFGTGGDFTPSVLNNIAQAGGTDAPPAGGDLYYQAADESSLSAALADIVARSMVVETCNGLDDDCDGKVDESLPFGQPGSAAQPEALFCDGEGKRSDAQNTQVRARPDYADDLARSQSIDKPVVCGRVADTCDHPNHDDDCDGKLDEDATNLNSCGQCPGQTDICDGIDNDCDGVIDEEPGTGKPFSVCPLKCTGNVPCGSDIGECVHGNYLCTNGALDTSVCVGQKGPQDEICDEKDNDCDGIVDNPAVLARECQTSWGSTGICVPGIQYCAKGTESRDASGYHVDSSGQPVCVGQVNPEDREQCDNLDHDCDGNAFTCTQMTCVSAQPQGVGDVCGQGVGTCQGTLVCDTTTQPPSLRCNAKGGMDEICDGQDNDCDGAVDEDLGPEGPCGSGTGECKPGMYQCDKALGKRVCVGAVTPNDEVCDALDNDCDGKVDEGLGLGDACGTGEGQCELGKLVCESGRTVCSGEIGPQPETCDCADNDCDGKIDEAPTGGNPLCPGDSVCTMCQCALPCAPTQEFVAQCPQGKAPVTEDGSCFCVGERCKDLTCGEQTIERDGVVQCAPQSSEVGSCICQNNECVFRCSGVTCSSGLVCDPTDGRCKTSSCLLPQFKCADGQHCVMVDNTFECQDDPCANKQCAADEACRDGTCVKSCGGVSCADKKHCVDGACVVDRCASTTCSLVPDVCDPATGTCVAAGQCVLSGCASGEVCNAVSGDCVEDPCLKTRCPVGERCVSETGQCERRCDDQHVYCDGQCVDPSSNRRYCGASADCAGDNAGTSCADGLVCSLGACSDSCAKQLVNCGGTCIDPQSDGAYCGASGDCSGDNAGQLCADGESCVQGECHSTHPTPSVAVQGVAATGGGGCACSVGMGSAAPRSRGPWALLGGLLLLGLARVRRRRCPPSGAGVVWPVVAGAVWLAVNLLTGCDASAFPLERTSPDAGTSAKKRDGGGDSGSGMGRRDGGSGSADASMRDAQASDASMSHADACLARELCNGRDDDCDGKIDEDPDYSASKIDIQTDSRNCGGCRNACAIAHAFNACQSGQCVIDRSQGEQGCDIGYYDLDGNASNGCEYRCTKTANDDKACDLVDNDCDGKIDEDVDLRVDVNNCGNCGLQCVFAHAADGASCVDGKCVLDPAKCDDGFRDVDGKPGTGCEYRCPGAISAETCNALDDDCDGATDEDIRTQDDARIGVACGSDQGQCKKGLTACKDGAPLCTGQVDPAIELCDGKDNNCNGMIDEDFDLATDKANCGSCGHGCVLDNSVTDGHATLICDMGQCKVGACIGNWVDANGSYGDGCEKTCTVTSVEYCDNVDNDCNGLVDDNVSMPAVVCAARETGVCATDLTALRTNGPQCKNGVLSCNLANTGIAGVQQDETLCDGLDNDCDGRVDEMLPAVGKPCSRGKGSCMTTGVYVCDSQAAGGYSCGASTPTTGTAEACDGKDDDCNDSVDDFPSPGPSTNVSGIEVVNLGGDVLMMAYEASRPDATSTSQGSMTQKPCSAPDRLPWTNLTWSDANAACCALNASGQCSGDETGWRLCDVDTWEAACKGPGGSCIWAYSDAPGADCAHAADNTDYTKVCLGAEDTVTCADGASQCATFGGDYTDCYADWSNGNRLFDMSGNVREWTYSTAGQAGVYSIRGGGYSNLEIARTCSFDFNVGDSTFHFPTTGFRCCYYP